MIYFSWHNWWMGESTIPVTYKCKGCGYELYRFEKVGQDFYGVRTPSEIKLLYGGRCPRCGRELGKPGLDDVKIKLLPARRRVLSNNMIVVT